jgi:hypothetical protein
MIYVPDLCIKEYFILCNKPTNALQLNIFYHIPTCSGHFCDQHQGVIQEYKQYTNNCTKCITKTLNDTVNILSPPCGHKMSSHVIMTNGKIGCVYIASWLYRVDTYPVTKMAKLQVLSSLPSTHSPHSSLKRPPLRYTSLHN